MFEIKKKKKKLLCVKINKKYWEFSILTKSTKSKREILFSFRKLADVENLGIFFTLYIDDRRKKPTSL